LLTSIHVAEDVCFPVAHRQVVLTIPKRLRVHTRFDRKLLGELSSCAWTCLKAEAGRLLGREDVVPGMIGAIQTHGELLHWHPHIHVLITCGAWTPEDQFLELPQFDVDRLLAAWQDAVFELYLAEEKIEPEVVENMRTWEHSGFSVDQSVFLPAGDQAGIERLIQYMTRCPFSLSRLVKVSDTGQIVYQAEKQACRAFPDPKGDGTRAGVKRNFQILSPLDFLAEFTQHRPSLCSGARAKGSHLIRPRSLLKRRLVLEQVTRYAQEGGSCYIRRAIGRGCGSFSQQPSVGDADQATLYIKNPAKWTHCVVQSVAAR
jgi:hypothetical protein